MKGKDVLIPLILFTLLIISACNVVPPGTDIEVEGDYAQKPVFNPKGGVYNQDSLTISISTPEPDAVILYSFNESIPLGLDSWVYAVQSLSPSKLDSCATFFMNYEDGDSLGFTELLAIGNCYQLFYDLNETLPGGAYAWMYDLDGLNEPTVNTCVDMVLNIDLTAEITEDTPGMSECEDVFIVLNATANDFVETNLYEGPITIYDDKHISAVAIAPEMNPSDLITEVYYFDRSGPTNIPPYVAITFPHNGDELTQGTVNLQATASDSDGTVARVEFYRDGSVLLGSDTSAPYEYAWQNMPVGTYFITAKAFDNDGGSTVSDFISVTIKETVGGENNPPTVSISSPRNGASHQDTEVIPVVADASDSDGTISKVEIIVNGAVTETMTAYPYGYFWENPTPGQYIIGARAYDNEGASTLSQPITVTVESSASCQIDNDCPADLICENGACIQQPYDCHVDSDCDSGQYCASDNTCQPIPPDIINCGADMQCFINAAESCSKAKIQYADSVDLLGVITTTDVYAEVRGYNQFNKCVYYQRTDSIEVDLTEERIQQMVALGFLKESEIEAYIAQLNDIAKEEEGLEFLCSFNKDDLVAMLVRWSEGTFTGVDLTVAECSQEHLNIEPTVHITNPAPDDREFEEGDSLILIARAEDSDGEIDSVEFLVDDGNGYTTSGKIYSEPYTKIIHNLEIGVQTIYAKTYDDEGAIGNSLPIIITVKEKGISTNEFPQVTLNSPNNNDVFLTTEGVSLLAVASDSDGSVSKVEFLATDESSTSRIYSDTSEPYEYVWETAEEGTYILEAKVTDDEGAEAFSQEIRINIIKPKLLLNAEPSWVVYDENETEVTCISNLKDEPEFSNLNAEIKLFRNGTEVANGTNEVSEGKINLEQGNYEYVCSSNTYPFEDVTETLYVRDGITPPWILFNFDDFIEFPDWTTFSKEDFKNLANLRFRNKYGGIFFQDIISILRNLDLRDSFEITKYKAQINSNRLPEFDVRAKIEFYDVDMVDPVPMRNGDECSDNDCENFTHNKTQKRVSFYVDGFSSYTIEEKPFCGDDICNADEDYQTCAADCEKPDTNTRGWCHPEWECGDWGTCRSDGYQIRSCTDRWSCNSIKDMPETYQRCGPTSIRTAGENPSYNDDNNEPAPYVPPEDNRDLDSGSSPQPQEPYSPPVYNDDTNNRNLGADEDEGGFMSIFSKYWWVLLIIVGVLIGGGIGLFFFLKSHHEEEEDTTFVSDTSAQQQTQPYAGTQQQYASQQTGHGLTDDSLRSGVEFVKKMISHGKTPDEVKNAMKSAGWTDVQLEGVFSKLNK